MHRFAAGLLCVLLAVAASAAPAPLSRPWVNGWDKEVCAQGDCNFDRKGDQLTITVPGKDHALDVRGGRLGAPHLLRDVEGDFVVEVRVRESFEAARGAKGGRRIGVLLRGGESDPVITFTLALDLTDRPRRLYNVLAEVSRKGGGPAFRMGTYEGPPVGAPGWLRLERRGSVGRVAFRADGEKWAPLNVPLEMRLPAKMKVGVVAETTAQGTMKAEFSAFRLTLLKR